MLRIEAEQGAQDGPGWCRLAIHGLPAHADRVELSIRGPGASRAHLGASGWEESESWLELPVARDGETLIARLGPPYTLWLGKVSTVEIRARIAGGEDQRTRLAWPRIVLPADNDAREPAAPAAAPRPPEPAPPAPEPIAPRIDPPVIIDPPGPWGAPPRPWGDTSRPRRGVLLAIVGTIGLLLILVPAAVWLLTAWEETDVATTAPDETPARAFTEEAVRAFLAGDPDGPSALAEAALYEAAGHPDLALLLYRHAERRGEPKAALAIGRMYDPEGFEAARSAFPAPDADQAASYYERGAEAGEAEAQFRLGRLLLSGRTSGEADAERGAVWLQRAAEQGNAEARAALDQLQKQVP